MFAKAASVVIQQGGVLLYPTEGVWGLGCDPWCLAAVERICCIKGRSIDKGLILITTDWRQVRGLIALELDGYLSLLTKEQAVTWVFPATTLVPAWITGNLTTVAIRCCQHPAVQALGTYWKQPIVSTSANLSKEKVACIFKEVDLRVIEQVDGVLEGETQGLGKASVIKDLVTQRVLRG